MTLIGRRCKGGDVLSRALLIARRLCLPGRVPRHAAFLRRFWTHACYFLFCAPMTRSMRTLGGSSPGVPPLPIPNREVKPGCADGTAPQCGRVGRRPLFPDPSPRPLHLQGAGGRHFMHIVPVLPILPLMLLLSLLSIFRATSPPLGRAGLLDGHGGACPRKQETFTVYALRIVRFVLSLQMKKIL